MSLKKFLILQIPLLFIVACTVSTQSEELNFPVEDEPSLTLDENNAVTDNIQIEESKQYDNQDVNGGNTEGSEEGLAEVEDNNVVIADSEQPNIDVDEKEETLDDVNLEGPALPVSDAPIEGPSFGSQTGSTQGEPAQSTGSVTIITIIYDGNGDREPDEHVDVLNGDNSPIQLMGWTLSTEDIVMFTFPQYIIQPGEMCRIYTNEDHPEWCGFDFGANSPLWNSDGDCAYLYNSDGNLVSKYCYP